MKTGVLSHGYHTGAPNWEEIIWGKPPYAMGRVPKAVQVALRENAELIVFGTGASEKDGMKESEYIIRYLFENFNRLREFSAFRHVDFAGLPNKIAPICVPEIISQNTAEEVAFAGWIFINRGIDKIYQVSSPFHILRCHRDAIAAFRKTEPLNVLLPGLAAVASDTGPDPAGTIILEPPHRPDRPASNLYKFVQKIISLPRDEQEEIIKKALD